MSAAAPHCPVAEPRWLVRRKAEAAAAMAGANAVAVEEACSHYGVSVAQFEACRRAVARSATLNAPASRLRTSLFRLRWLRRSR